MGVRRGMDVAGVREMMSGVSLTAEVASSVGARLEGGVEVAERVVAGEQSEGGARVEEGLKSCVGCPAVRGVGLEGERPTMLLSCEEGESNMLLRLLSCSREC